MQKNDIVKIEAGVFRILDIDGDQVLAIDCEKKNMPQFFPVSFFKKGEILKEISSSFLSWEELCTFRNRLCSADSQVDGS